MQARSLLLLSVLLASVAACGRGPDVLGRVTLASGIEAPRTGELILEASPVTRVSERMTVYPLRLDMARLTFPFEFELGGNGEEPSNKLWGLSARVQEDPATLLLEGSTGLQFKCDADGDNCEAGRVTVVLDVP